MGAETANQLANYLKGVTIIEMLDAIAGDEIVVPRWDLLEDLDRNKESGSVQRPRSMR